MEFQESRAIYSEAIKSLVNNASKLQDSYKSYKHLVKHLQSDSFNVEVNLKFWPSSRWWWFLWSIYHTPLNKILESKSAWLYASCTWNLRCKLFLNLPKNPRNREIIFSSISHSCLSAVPQLNGANKDKRLTLNELSTHRRAELQNKGKSH